MIQLGTFGINSAVVKLVAEDVGKGNIQSVYRNISCAWFLVVLSGGLVSCCLIGSRYWLCGVLRLEPGLASLFVALLPWIAVLNVIALLTETLGATIQGLGRTDLITGMVVFSQALTVLLASILLHLGYGLTALLVANLISYLAQSLLCWVFIRSMVRGTAWAHLSIEFSRCKRLAALGGWIFGGGVLNFLLVPLNKVVLARLSGVGSVPVYDIAFTSAVRIRSVLEAGLRALMPEVSRMAAGLQDSQGNGVVRLGEKATKLAAVAGALIYVPLLAGAEWLFPLWLKSRYNPEIVVSFRIVLCGSYVSLIGVPAYYCLLGLGRGRETLAAHALQTVFNALGLLGWLLVTGGFTALAASVSTAVGMGVSGVYLIWTAAQRGVSGGRFASAVGRQS
jgi:O-antigen/teichoic acid export membrane protein